MVSEEIIRGAEVGNHECGDHESIKPIEIKFFSGNNKSSSPTSSEGSVKLTSAAEQSPDSSAKDNYDYRSNIRNETFTKTDADDSSNSEDVIDLANENNESEFLSDESTLGLMCTRALEESSQFDPATWLHQTFVNLTNKFENSSLFIVDSDAKLDNLTLEESRFIYENMEDCWILRARNYLADYQVMRGTPREEYSFCTLIKLMGHASGHSLQALYNFLLNIVPVLEIFLHIARFVLDKAICIKNARDTQSMLINSVVFGIELIIIYFCINIIFGYIVSPVIRIPFGIIGKMLLYT